MKYISAILFLMISSLACVNPNKEDHPHAPDGSHPGEDGLRTVSYTLYSDRTELFVEFKPLVVGSTTHFAAHLTRLGEHFLPFTEGTVSVSLLQSNKGLRNIADAPGSPGIFRLSLQPVQAGVGRLVFDIQTKDFKDQLIIDNIEVYADEKTAIAAQPKDGGPDDISFLKDQAWKIEFANTPVVKENIHDVVKATGEIQSAPGDEVTIAARSNGIVKFSGNAAIMGAAIRSGQTIFTISGGEIPFENVAAARQAARAELATAQSEYNRANELIKDRLITQGEFQAAKLRLQQAQITLSNIERNYSSGGKSITSPIAGYVKNILVSEGQFVSAGEPLATITKNQRLILRADVSLKDADRISSISEANFTIIQNNLTYNTRVLNGRLLAVGKTTGDRTPFIPVQFMIDGRPGMIPGSYAEVFIKTTPIYNALVIPASALIEEQGIYFVYVQTGGESFQKREVKLGANDGEKLQVLSGLSEGERVVTKGAYHIKLSQASGALPDHGHEH
jgi:membrane fusion protein, heavy metal efflux system